MTESTIVKTDQGAVNARILAREAKADFRRVEAASLKMRTHLTSAEAKRLFVRMFNTLQLNAHFISVIARTRLDHKEVEGVEATLRNEIDAAKQALSKAIDGAEALFKVNGISSFATYDTQPLEIEVGILSSSGRRYLEVLNQLDQLMPLLQTLEIHEVITTQALDIQRALLKRKIRSIATSARRLATNLRRRMNELTAADGRIESPPIVDDDTARAEASLEQAGPSASSLRSRREAPAPSSDTPTNAGPVLSHGSEHVETPPTLIRPASTGQDSADSTEPSGFQAVETSIGSAGDDGIAPATLEEPKLPGFGEPSGRSAD